MARFEKGHKKVGGKKKGTPNKRHTIFEALDLIHTEDGKPVCIVKMFFDGLMDMPPFQRVDAILEFMKFIYPIRKHTTHEEISDSELKEILEAKLNG